jgi:AAA domain
MIALAPLATPQRKKIYGPKILLLGEPGHGKTDAIRTVLEAGLKVFIIFTEPGMEVLLDKRRGKVYSCADGLHWTYIPPVTADWKELSDAANLLNTFTYKQCTEMGGVNKAKYRSFYDYITAHFLCKCDRCGKGFGPADQLEPYDEWCLVDDSLSSVSIMALNLVIGSKPAVHQGEYGAAMFNLERFINKFAFDVPSMAIFTAHIEREGDEVSGGTMNMAATLGRKLAPKIPRPFSDVIHCKREGTKFTWSTITPNMLLKTRNLALADNLPPTFAPIIQKWRESVKSETDYFNSQNEGAPAPT